MPDGVKLMNPEDNYPEWWTWDGMLVKPGIVTDKGTIPNTPENWERYYLKSAELRLKKESSMLERCLSEVAKVVMEDANKQENSRRLRLIYVSPENILVLARLGMNDLPDYCYKIIGRQPLPSDTLIHGVEYDFASQYFVFCVWSKEFSPVPNGERVPEFDTAPFNLEWVSLKLKSE